MTKGFRLLRRAAAFEWRLYRSLYRWLRRRPDVTPGATAFPYVGVVAALLWVFIGVSALELVVLHVALPWEGVRVAADALGIWGLVWMLGLAASYRVYPHAADGSGLRVRNGFQVDVTVPWDAVAAVRVHKRGRAKSRKVQLDRDDGGTVLNVVMGSQTNVDVELRRALTLDLPAGPQVVTAVRLYADDPRGLARLTQEHIATEHATQL